MDLVSCEWAKGTVLCAGVIFSPPSPLDFETDGRDSLALDMFFEKQEHGTSLCGQHALVGPVPASKGLYVDWTVGLTLLSFHLRHPRLAEQRPPEPLL